MSIARKNIIIAGAAAVAIVTVAVVIVIVLVSQSGQQSDQPDGPPNNTGPVTRGIFKRCDGLSDPIDDITISSCPNWDKLGYCELKDLTKLDITLSFTPSK